MNFVNKVELRLEKFEKCHLICDNDCPLGALYDYSCALQAFIIHRMKEAEEAQKASKVEQLPQG
jgi:hypothetical protein